jgi:hypothetical protein
MIAALRHRPHLGRMALPNGGSDRSGASVWTISLSWERRICAASCEATTTKFAPTGHWTKTRQTRAQFSGSEPSVHVQSLADFIINTPGFRFSVHTGSSKNPTSWPSADIDRGKLREVVRYLRTNCALSAARAVAEKECIQLFWGELLSQLGGRGHLC